MRRRCRFDFGCILNELWVLNMEIRRSIIVLSVLIAPLVQVVHAQEAPVDFDQVLEACNVDPPGCQLVLTRAVQQVTALANVPQATVNGYLATLATIAVSTAQSHAEVQQQMAEVVSEVAEAVAASDSQAAQDLQAVATQLTNGQEVDLTQIGGSPT